MPGGKLRPGVNPAQFVQQQPGGGQSPIMSQGSPGLPPNHPLSPMGTHQRMPSNEALAGPAVVHQSKLSFVFLLKFVFVAQHPYAYVNVSACTYCLMW